MKPLHHCLAALLAGVALVGATPAFGAVNVLACEPEWAALTGEIAGDKARITSATTALQDPHHIEARPALIAQARRADLLVCTGAELEIGWLPLLQRESGNAGIQSGRAGYFEAARFARLIEKPATLDRAMGDIHAAGNPHLHLDPRNLLPIADALAKRLSEIDPPNAAHYEARHRDFESRWRAAIGRWEQQAAPLRGVPVVVHHRSLSYLADWLGLKIVADLEPKPGIDPSAAYLGQLLAGLRSQPAKMVLRTAYQSTRASDWIAAQAGIAAVTVPFTVGGTDAARDLFSLFDDTLARLAAAAR
jgi:zinc/manganese transport system substrate-binding protein